MTSQISIRKLIKLEMKQNFWMFALSALVQFLAGPVYYLLAVDIRVTNHQDSIYVVNRLCSFFDEGYFLMQLLTMMIVIGICIFNYRYLFSKRMVDMYHSMPITRLGLFWSKYLHGFFTWFLPFIAASLSVMLISFLRLGYYSGLSYVGTLFKAWTESIILLLFCFFIFYHLFLIAAYLSGNILNLLTNIIIIGISAVCIYALLLCLAEVSFDTFCSSASAQPTDILMGVSPLSAPFYAYYIMKKGGTFSLITEHPCFLLTVAFYTIFLLWGAICLSRKRPSELAEKGTPYNIYKTSTQLLASLLSALAISLFFSQIVSNSFRIFWGVFGVILGGILCFGVLNSIFHCNIKCFFKNLPQMLSITGVSILLFLSFHFDWFGYDAYLPDKAKIAGIAIDTNFGENTANINLNPNSSWSYNDEEVIVYQEQLLTDKDICYDFLNLVINKEQEEQYHYLYAKIQLENGRTYYRQYTINDSDFLALAPFIEMDAYKNTNYKVSTGAMGYPYSMEVNAINCNSGITLGTLDIKTLLDAYFLDFEEHYNFAELSSCFNLYRLQLQFRNEEGEYFYNYLEVPDNYERTLAVISTYKIDCITSAEDIVHLTPHISIEDISHYGSVENYFTTTVPPVAEKNNAYQSDVVVYEYIGSTAIAEENILQISDREILEQLYPLLYFGSYYAPFGTREYIYLGDVYTTQNDYVDAWVKPGTLPEKYITMIEESMAEAAKE